MTNLKEIYNLWLTDLQFREDFNKDPEGALKSRGFEMNPEDLTKIQALIKLDKSTNEDLDDRISK